MVACIDEGCGKEEDLVAIMSLSSSVIKIETEEGKRILNVVKHPRMEPTKIEVSVIVRPRVVSSCFDAEYVRKETEMAALGGESDLKTKGWGLR